MDVVTALAILSTVATLVGLVFLATEIRQAVLYNRRWKTTTLTASGMAPATTA